MTRATESERAIYDPSASDAELRETFLDGDVPVAVYGLGKMGLPLAAVYADVCGNVTGVDIDESVVETVRAGDCHVEREPGLPELVSDVAESGALDASADPQAAAEDAAVHVLMVPTLLDEDDTPDLSSLEAAVRDIGAGLSPGDLVVVECTVPPRTTSDVVVPLLAEESGLDPSEFGAAACPERTASGRALRDVRGSYPKVVGGVDDASTRAARVIYGEISSNEIVPTADAATAETVKVFEGVYRDVNIALANQLAQYSDTLDVDVNEAIEIANTLPYSDIHTPGPGVGGHCIPVYPHFLLGGFDVDDQLLAESRAVNDEMPEYTVALLEEMLDAHGYDGERPTVLVLGLAYRGNVAELRYAPGPVVGREAASAGANVLAVDPLVPDWSEYGALEPVDVDALPGRAGSDRSATAEDGASTEVESTMRADSDGGTRIPEDVDAVVVTAGHDEFDDLDWDAFDAPILDGRFVLDQDAVDAPVYTIGGRWP